MFVVRVKQYKKLKVFNWTTLKFINVEQLVHQEFFKARHKEAQTALLWAGELENVIGHVKANLVLTALLMNPGVEFELYSEDATFKRTISVECVK